jgi:hypothetical protein
MSFCFLWLTHSHQALVGLLRLPTPLLHLTCPTLQKPPRTYGKHPFARKAVAELSYTLDAIRGRQNFLTHLHNAWRHTSSPRRQA